MVRLIIIIFIFFLPFSSFAEKLTEQEILFFNFIDLNKDNNLSYEEINRSIKLFFQLIDENKDSNISELEIIKLKEIIDSIQ